MVAEAVTGFLIVIQFNAPTIYAGIASLAIVAVYPFAKRLTSWPQAVLGLAFAWGGLIGWVAERGAIALPALLVYGAAVLWTIGYDTVYAIQDIADDPAAGIQSTARLFGHRVAWAVGLFYAASVFCMQMAIVAAGAVENVMAQVGVAGWALHLAWQVNRLDAADPAGAMRLFRSNRDAGLILCAGLAAAAFTG